MRPGARWRSGGYGELLRHCPPWRRCEVEADPAGSGRSGRRSPRWTGRGAYVAGAALLTAVSAPRGRGSNPGAGSPGPPVQHLARRDPRAQRPGSRSDRGAGISCGNGRGRTLRSTYRAWRASLSQSGCWLLEVDPVCSAPVDAHGGPPLGAPSRHGVPASTLTRRHDRRSRESREQRQNDEDYLQCASSSRLPSD